MDRVWFILCCLVWKLYSPLKRCCFAVWLNWGWDFFAEISGFRTFLIILKRNDATDEPFQPMKFLLNAFRCSPRAHRELFPVRSSPTTSPTTVETFASAFLMCNKPQQNTTERLLVQISCRHGKPRFILGASLRQTAFPYHYKLKSVLIAKKQTPPSLMTLKKCIQQTAKCKLCAPTHQPIESTDAERAIHI